MPNALTTGTTSGSAQKTGSAASAAPAKGVPFGAAAKPAAALDFSTISYTLTAAQQQVPEIQLQSNGWLEAIEVCVTGTTSGNSAATTFNADGPFSVLQQVAVADPGGAAFFSPHTGYEIYLRNKYEGVLQPPFCDARNDPDYVATTGTVATGGSFFFRLWLTFAIRPYDVYCALANGDSGRRYKLDMWLGTLSQVYGTNPTSAPSVTLRGTAHFRLQPPQTLAGQPCQQTPPWYTASGTARSYWDKVTPALPGANNASVGVQLNIQGRVIRTIILVARNSSGARVGQAGDGNFPDPITWVFNNYPEFVLRDTDWVRSMKQCYGYNTVGYDVANGLDTGVRVLHQFMSRPVGFVNPNQSAQLWLQTVAGSQVLVQGTFGASVTSLSALVNDIAPGPNAAAMFIPAV
jgi:hypothetical protein